MTIELGNISPIISVLQFVGTIIVFCVIKFNNLDNISKDVKDIVKAQKEQSSDISLLKQDISYLKGKSESNDAVINILEKVLTK